MDIHFAVRRGVLEGVRSEVERGADVNIPNPFDNGRRPLHCAASMWEFLGLPIIRFLIEKGADIHATDTQGLTPLHSAAQYKDLPNVRYLVEQGAEVNARDNRGNTPLHLAYNRDIARYLLQNRADVNARNDRDETPLHIEADDDFQIQIAEELVLYGRADVNARDQQNRTPLHLVTESRINSPEAVLDFTRLLVKNGADKNARDDHGNTPIQKACEKGILEVVEYLHRNGALVNTQNSLGITPLHRACSDRNWNIHDIYTICYLVKHGRANVNARDHQNATPLHYTTRFNFCPDRANTTVQYLVGHGASVRARDNENKTPLGWARENNHTAAVKYLENCEANQQFKLVLYCAHNGFLGRKTGRKRSGRRG